MNFNTLTNGFLMNHTYVNISLMDVDVYYCPLKNVMIINKNTNGFVSPLVDNILFTTR